MLIRKLKGLLTKRDKQFLLGLLFFSIFISLIEMVAISLIMPFIAVASDFNLIHSNEYYSWVYTFFSFNREVEFVIIFGIVLIGFYFFRSTISLLYFYLLSKFTQGRYYLIVYRLFKTYLGMSYQEFVRNNSSMLTKTIVTEAHNLTQLIFSALFMLSEFFIIIFIYGLMLYIDYQITFFLTLFLLLNAWLMLKVISKKIKKVGDEREEAHKIFYELLNRSFGNFKLIKLQSKNEDVLSEFGKASFSYANTNIMNTTLANVPRLFLEAIGFGLIVAIISYLVWKDGSNISNLLPMISTFVLALYRLMPSINRIMTSYNLMLFYYKSLDIVYHDLLYKTELLGSDFIDFKKSVRIENLNFEYEKGKTILKDLNLTIQKGEKIAFVGESGSGKSTLVDLIIGLYKTNKGSIYIDDVTLSSDNLKSWRAKVGYIPQSVYLFDGAVGENVAFGFKYNKERVIGVLKKAKIYNFLETKEGVDTLVGEGGILLSGGQKQRIAIARALYSNPEILVLDEATSALDDATEQQIMDEIYDICEDKTLIIIAHRLTTLTGCDRIYRLKDGRVVDDFNEKDKCC